MWRNWQTRRSQKPVVATPWWFKSTHPHQAKAKVRRLCNAAFTFAFFLSLAFSCSLLPVFNLDDDEGLVVVAFLCACPGVYRGED